MLHKWNLFAVRIRFALPLLNVDIILFATYTAKSATDLIQIVCISGLMQVANKLYQPVDFACAFLALYNILYCGRWISKKYQTKL